MKLYKPDNVAIVGDLHSGVHCTSQTWLDLTIEYANWLKDTLIQNNVKDVIFEGDITHDRTELSLLNLHYLNKFFNILKDFNIIIVIGNHDSYYLTRNDINSLEQLDRWDNVTIVDHVTLYDDVKTDKKVVFCPYIYEYEEIPKCDVLIGHFEMASYNMQKNRMCEKGISSERLLEKSDLIFSGHFHLRQERSYPNGKVIYTGNTYEQDWGDCGDEKGIYLLNLCDKSYKFIENDQSPKHKKILLSELVELMNKNINILDELKSNVPHNIIDFQVDREVEDSLVSKLLTKISTLKPLDLKTTYSVNTVDTIDLNQNLVFDGVDLKKDIIDFISLPELGHLEYREETKNYILDAYNRAKETQKVINE